jgi:hypothetical protein
MPLTPSPSPQYQPLPMFERGQPSTAALYNLIAQKALDSVEANRAIRTALESQLTSLESRVAAATPNFTALINDANTLQQQVGNAIAANNSSNTALDSIQNNLSTNDQNAQIQLDRINPITALIDSLTIGEEIQGYSDLLNRIAGASRLASRILGTDASGNVVWRAQGSVGSGVLLRAAIFSRRLTDSAAGGSVAALQSWNPIALDPPTFNNIGLTWNNTNKQATLPGGEYVCFGFSVGSSNGFKCRLRNINSNTVLAFGTPAKGTTSASVSGAEPFNFISRLQGAFFISNSVNVDFQSWFDTAGAVVGNTQGASSNLAGYTPQQSALVLLRVIY